MEGKDHYGRCKPDQHYIIDPDCSDGCWCGMLTMDYAHVGKKRFKVININNNEYIQKYLKRKF